MTRAAKANNKNPPVPGALCDIMRAMGRHARGAARSSVTRLIVCSSVVLIVGGAGLLTYRMQPAPSANSVTTMAVVVSSLACTDGPGGTAVDMLNPAGPLAGDAVRATLDACGYQEGQQLAVQYPDGDPTQLSLAGTDAVDLGTGDRLLPIGLLIAALLALGAVLAVWLDSRRGHRRPAHSAARGEGIRGGTQARIEPEQLPVAGSVPLPSAQVDDIRPTLADLGDGETDWSAEWPKSGDTARRQDDDSVDLVFPFNSSLADSLHDELFTHRSVYS